MVESRKQAGPVGSISAHDAGAAFDEDEFKSMLDDIAKVGTGDRGHGDPAYKPASVMELIDALASFSHRLFQAHSAFVEARIDGHDITLRQFVLLNAISDLDSPNQRELTLLIGMDRSTLSDVIRRLSANGHILQKQSQEDARAKVISLTELGRSTLARTAPIISRANQEFFGVLDEVEMQSLARIQSRLLRLDGAQTGREESAPSVISGNSADTPPRDNTASLNRLQRARTAFEASLITQAEFESEKRRYLEGDPS